MSGIAEALLAEERDSTAPPVSRRRWSGASVIVAIVLFAGTAVLAYPTAATWFSDLAHQSEISGYIDDVGSSSAGERAAVLEAARAYNENLPNGPLRDPYILNAAGRSESIRDGWPEYERQLSDTPGKPIARIRIPAIGADLPVYHGTDDGILSRGIGHLYGSGLPVGGEGTHSVLAGHSGLPGSTLFTHLDQLTVGDPFFIEVAGETLAYEVDQIRTVAPDDAEALRQAPGKDYVTLLTCTPTGVNTHRLLVRGERVDLAAGQERARAVTATISPVGFPWWIATVVAGAAGAVFVAWPRRPRETTSPRRDIRS